jgi:Zn-dependent M28 family amino/carboxypeptidase
MASPASAQTVADSTDLRREVTVGGVVQHARALQRVADRNAGNRSAGSAGYDASASYVARRLRLAAYDVTVQPFEFPYYVERAPSTLARTAPTPRTYESTDFLTMQYSGSGDVTARVQPVDLVLPPTPQPSSTSGCEATDFVGFAAGGVALLQRGTCNLGVKARNALAAGASAVLIFNEGQADRQAVFRGTVSAPISIPVLTLSYAAGQELATLAAAGEVTVNVVTSTVSEMRRTVNVLGDTPAGRADRVVVVGAHLDSVVAGPGINDNGSGTAGILEIAEEMAELRLQPINKVRFAFWGAEELGLLGSTYYVGGLDEAARARIGVNLNFDMLGSPNFVRLVYDGDGSASRPAGPPGSDVVEQVLTRYFASRGLPTEPTEFSGRSDYGPFIAVGIPAGGLFSGAEGVKTAAQASVYGGTAGRAYDPCYHQACDTIANVNRRGLSQLVDGAAHATLTFALRETPVRPGAGTPARAGIAPEYVGSHLAR